MEKEINLFLPRGAMNDKCRLQLVANFKAPLLLFLGLAIVSVLAVRGCAAVKKVAGEMTLLLAVEQKMEKGRRRKVEGDELLARQKRQRILFSFSHGVVLRCTCLCPCVDHDDGASRLRFLNVSLLASLFFSKFTSIVYPLITFAQL